MAAALLLYLRVATVLLAREPVVHYLHQGAMPPGAIGSRQLQRGGPLPGFFQPAEIKAPAGVMLSLAADGRLDRLQKTPLRAGFLIGQVYRLRVASIPGNPGVEVFPSVEIIDRLYAPAGQQIRFAIPIELTQEDLELARDGKFVTRVVYLEDPNRALPVRDDPGVQNWFDIGPRRDPLAAADALGRPVAIIRMGARLPDNADGPSADFLYGCPTFMEYPQEAGKTAPERPQS